MKKNILSTIIALLLSIGAQAQDQELFNHMSASIGLGVINGITAEVAFPMTHSFALRAGYDYWPTTKMSTDLNIVNVDGQAPATAIAGLPSKMEVEYKDYFPTFHLLVDFYPFKKYSFHITAGAYFGKDKVIKAYNKDAASKAALASVYQYNMQNPNNRIGLEMGDYLLEPDQAGNINAAILVKKFRPYLGVGFGRAVPTNRFSVGFDLGVEMWGEPEVFVNDAKIKSNDLKGDSKSLLQAISKASLGPIISVRLTGRIL